MTRRQRRRQNRKAWRERRRTASSASSSGSKRRRAPRQSKSGSKRIRRSIAGWSSDYALGRAYGIRPPKGVKGKKARRFVGREGFKRARAAAGKRLSYNELMTALSGTSLKAWVCAGPTRTGCGGGRKRYGGSRQIGVLKP